MTVPKKIPQRKCTGCAKMFPKNTLIRIVHSPSGDISLDFTGKKSGRGAYICKSIECFNKARKQKRISSSLGVTIPEEVYDALERELNEQK